MQIVRATLCENGIHAMKFSRCYTFVCWALAGLVLSEPTAAMTLGRLRGASVLGQPLALAIPLQTTGDEDVDGLCVAAEVYFGESPVETSRVTARLEGGAGTALIRVSVSKPVDEPIVTVYLKTGCQQQSMRKYVLLSEFSSEVQAPLPSATGGAAAAKGGVRPSPSGIVAGVSAVPLQPTAPTARRSVNTKSSAKTVSATSALSDGAQPLPSSEKRATVSAQPMGHPQKKKAGTVGGSRLQLLPLELTQDWEPSLRLTDQLPAVSGDMDEQKRAQAAELWRVINATPEEILQQAGKRAALEAELNSLVASSRANQSAITELKSQLKAAHEDRMWNPVVYVLLALLVASGAGLVFVVSLRRKGWSASSPWWLGTGVSGESAQWHAGSAGAVPDSTVSRAVADAVQSQAQAPAGIDIPLSDSVLPTRSNVAHGISNSGSFANPPSGESKPMDFMHSNLGALRAINTHEMVDVRQQADFFVALGQHDEAVGALYGALGHGTESNPHIYLDLIALLHKLSRKDEYEKARHAFNALYTCHIPAYGEYSTAGRGLLEYPDLVMPLVSLWPKPVAMEYVEKCLLRDDTDSADCGIDRAAFEDLLLLHGILESVVVPASLDAKIPCPARTLAALSSSAKPFLASQAFSSLQGVDLDLSGGR